MTIKPSCILLDVSCSRAQLARFMLGSGNPALLPNAEFGRDVHSVMGYLADPTMFRTETSVWGADGVLLRLTYYSDSALHYLQPRLEYLAHCGLGIDLRAICKDGTLRHLWARNGDHRLKDIAYQLVPAEKFEQLIRRINLLEDLYQHLDEDTTPAGNGP